MSGGKMKWGWGSFLPFLSSMVTVSFAHFIKNLGIEYQLRGSRAGRFGDEEFSQCVVGRVITGWAYLTSFIFPISRSSELTNTRALLCSRAGCTRRVEMSANNGKKLQTRDTKTKYRVPCKSS
jgi:hypothetical protein